MPICLRPFKRDDVESGESVELQIVKIGARPLPICLVCKSCSDDVGLPARPTATVNIDGALYDTLLKTDESGNFTLRILHAGGREDELKAAMAAHPGELKLTLMEPKTNKDPETRDDRGITLLKTAYLSVFSLLGRYGYRYAKGRRQSV